MKLSLSIQHRRSLLIDLMINSQNRSGMNLGLIVGFNDLRKNVAVNLEAQLSRKLHEVAWRVIVRIGHGWRLCVGVGSCECLKGSGGVQQLSN